MCDPVTAGLILTAAGGGAKALNQNAALRAKDRETAAGIRRQSGIQRKANSEVNTRVKDIAGNTGEAERTAALEGFLNTLRSAKDTTGAPSDPLGLGGDRFAERVSGGEATTRQAGTERAGRLASIDAPGRQRLNESIGVGDTASSLNELGRQSSADDFITRLRVASKRPNPVIDALATIAQGSGSVLALKPGGTNLASLFKKGGLIDPVSQLPGSVFGSSPTVLG